MEKQFNTADFYEKCGCMSASQRAVRRDSVNTDCADSLTMVFIICSRRAARFIRLKGILRGNAFPELDKPFLEVCANE
ncbi:MAG: hypothetical protein ACLR56_06885 [Oscillospiraceae bacterium]